MADEMHRLLDYIVRTFVAHDEMVSIDLEASASDGGLSIESDKRRAIRRENARADGMSDAFGRGLALARDGLVVLDDRNPDENKMADALIHFLVSYDLASSRTVETEPNHYRYRVIVQWDQLQAVAKSAGVDLDQALRRYAS